MLNPKILVGVDGSNASLNALKWAAELAVKVGGSLNLVCAYTYPAFAAASLDGGFAAIDDLAIAQGAKAVLSNATELLNGYDLDITTQVVTGDAAGALVDLSTDYDLAVVGTRGRGGFTERLLGTVSSALPAHAHCPTIVIPFHEQPKSATDPSDRSATYSANLKRIVVGFDGSKASLGALEYAGKIAAIWGSELHVLHAANLGLATGAFVWVPTALDRQETLRELEKELDETLAVYENAGGYPISRKLVLEGSGAELLKDLSQAADLIVVGSRGRGGFKGLLLGSTSQAILHHSQCPVLVLNNKTEAELND